MSYLDRVCVRKRQHVTAIQLLNLSAWPPACVCVCFILQDASHKLQVAVAVIDECLYCGCRGGDVKLEASPPDLRSILTELCILPLLSAYVHEK